MRRKRSKRGVGGEMWERKEERGGQGREQNRKGENGGVGKHRNQGERREWGGKEGGKEGRGRGIYSHIITYYRVFSNICKYMQ